MADVPLNFAWHLKPVLILICRNGAVSGPSVNTEISKMRFSYHKIRYGINGMEEMRCANLHSVSVPIVSLDWKKKLIRKPTMKCMM